VSHYKTLGVSPSATAEEIKIAYRELSWQHHPDVGGDANVYATITRAYSVLNNPGMRSTYDAAMKLTKQICNQCGGQGIRWKQKGFLSREKELCSNCNGDGFFD
jgi:DnaJ-class molecular chaperone